MESLIDKIAGKYIMPPKLIVRVGVKKALKDTFYNLEKLGKHPLTSLAIVSAEYYVGRKVFIIDKTGTRLIERGKGKAETLPDVFVYPRESLFIFYDYDDYDLFGTEDEPLLQVMSSDFNLTSKIEKFIDKTLLSIENKYNKYVSSAGVGVAPAAGPGRRCPKGTRRNKKTGNCESAVAAAAAPAAAAPAAAKMPRCPRGTHRNKKTGLCEKA